MFEMLDVSVVDPMRSHTVNLRNLKDRGKTFLADFQDVGLPSRI